MKAKNVVAQAHGMTDEAWKRHANPWSVWTRFAAIPAMELAFWSRDWMGWWSLAGVAAVIVWLLNVRVFGPVEPTSWAAKGIYGEQPHVQGEISPAHKTIMRWLIVAGAGTFALIAWGLVFLELWPLVFGTTVLVMAQLWRIDRYSLLFEQHQSDAAQN